MIALLLKLDNLILPRSGGMHFAPYIWLVYLGFFFASALFYHPVEHTYWYATVGTVVFLIVYFNAYWRSAKEIKWNILAIMVIGSALAYLTPGASVFFVYASAFCCRLGTTRKAFTGLVVIASWIAIYSLYWSSSASFYIPGLFFTFMVGGINIYQHDIDLKRQELQLSQQEVRQLARTSERERIARDLHDLIGHTFSIITLKAELVGKLIDKDQEKALIEIKELEEISRDALKQIREVVTGYRTSDLNTELAYAKHILQSNDIKFVYQLDDLQVDDHINKELAIMLKELVTNILKYASANQVKVSIKQKDSSISMQVADDGVGFSADEQTQGYGLKGLKERINELSGQIKIENNSGTCILICLPAERRYDQDSYC